MENNKYVYCTNCENFKIDGLGDVRCKYENECNSWDAEDSRPISDRPHYEELENK